MVIEPRDLIRTVRLARRLTQLELGRATGITNIRLSQIEIGYVRPRPEELARIAGALGLDRDDVKLIEGAR
jgi:transcriptional regulator with XRE-family HTH domain